MKNPFPKYNVKIIVEGTNEDGERSGAKLTIKMPGILRVDIMAPEYKAECIAAVVRLLEQSLE